MPRRLAVVLVAVLVAVGSHAALPPDIDKALHDAKYVYIQSERKSGEWSKPAEIWFYADGDAVYVGTRPTSWRVKRIKAGRKKARIAVGKPDGPRFDAVGELRHDPAVEEKLMANYARKYPEGWAQHADGFRSGFKSGERVLVRYAPAKPDAKH
jgi:hypothetical protein